MKTKVSDRKALLHLAVRILTLPPIVIGVTLLLMYAPAGLLTRRELLLCEVFLLVIPLAAYPLREIFHIGKDRRRGQRGTALVCSAVGYLCGFLWSMLTPCSWLVSIARTGHEYAAVLRLLIDGNAHRNGCADVVRRLIGRRRMAAGLHNEERSFAPIRR